MKDTLTGIRQRLRTELTYIRTGDIYVTGDLDTLKDTAMLPAIAIKDGAVERKELSGGMIQYTQHITLGLWVRVFEEEQSMLGNAAAKGLLEIEADVDAALDECLLGITGMIGALPEAKRGESQPMNDGQRDMQRKLIPYVYIKQVLRPSQGG